jgi:hypothetical protein
LNNNINQVGHENGTLSIFAAPNCIYPNITLAINANTLDVTKQKTINIKHLLTLITLNLLTIFLAINVNIPPIIKVYKKNNNATLPWIEFVANACANDALPANTT